MMRLACAALTIALLSACGENEKEVACCAIEPKAKCESALAGIGATAEELSLIAGGGQICPSDKLTAERIRELDASWPAACREAGTPSPARAMSSGQCEATAGSGVSLDDLTPPPGVDVQKWAACGSGLKARGLSDSELWVMLHTPAYACPNVGVDEARIRAIIANDWEQAGCTTSTKAEMLSALETGKCGGDAG
jgi:hypothetical protein